MRTIILSVATLVAVACSASLPAASPSLTFEAAIDLVEVRGRIDHLAVDVDHGRLFVADLANGSIDVIDVTKRLPMQRIFGLNEPQEIVYSKRTQTLYVASGGDGMLRTYVGEGFKPGKSIKVGADADNVRIEDLSGTLYVGFDGGIAVLDANLKITGQIKLKAHPESFQLRPNEGRIYVNVPEAREIAVLDTVALKQVESWPTRALSSNFPMALDTSGDRLFVAFRQPSTLAIYEMTGRELQKLELCGDADDLHFDKKRGWLYASCGQGFVDVFAARTGTDGFVRIDRVETRSGARTSVYVPEWNQLFVAARATAQQPAAILVYTVGEER